MKRMTTMVSLTRHFALLPIIAVLTACGDGGENTSVNTTPLPNINWQLDKTELLDINNDGLIDLVTSFTSEQNVFKLSYRANLGNGSFDSEIIIDNNLSEQVLFFDSADINRDDINDIAIISSTSILVYTASSNAIFDTKLEVSASWTLDTTFNENDESQAVLPTLENIERSRFILSDVTGDGAAELIWLVYSEPPANFGGTFYSLLYRSINNGVGDFSSPVLLDKAARVDATNISSRLILLEPTDFNGDDIDEIAYRYAYFNGEISAEKDALLWIENTTTDTNTLQLNPYPDFAGMGAQTTSLIDWNLDGFIDVISYLEPSPYSGIDESMSLAYINSGTGQFFAPENVTDLNVIPVFTTADIDNDGTDDLIQYKQDYQAVEGEVFWQRKLGQNVEIAKKIIGYQGNILGSIDLDNDGHIDFVSQYNNTLHWYQNQGDATFTEHQISIQQ